MIRKGNHWWIRFHRRYGRRTWIIKVVSNKMLSWFKVRGKVKNDWEVVKQNTDFSPYLLYHTDYLVDLLTIEKEKEDNSLKLSSGFINKYANNEPRNIIVAFLIHLAVSTNLWDLIIRKLRDLWLNLFLLFFTDTLPLSVIHSLSSGETFWYYSR